jgi:asparagine synthase (glutamine-hydrolysing)
LSAIGGLFSREPRQDLAGHVDQLLSRMTHRGGDRTATASGAGFALGVSRFAWEEPPRLGGRTAVSTWQGVRAVADASLYYREDLRRALRDRQVVCESEEPADLIVAAYRAWGPLCAQYLEGDFAFLLIDETEHRVLASRDYVGRRGLHYHATASMFVVASTARAVATHPLVQAPVDLVTVAIAAGALLGGSRFTGFEGIHPVAAGSTVEWTPAAGVRTIWQWRAPPFRIGGASDVRESGEQLRALLTRSVAERFDGRTCAIWLSGGADSTAVFGAGSEALRIGMERQGQLLPVTVSYPEGDNAREDDHVNAIASRWNTRVAWIDSESVDLFEDLEGRAAVRDDPYAHTFEMMNRRLAQTSVSVGARVAFDGYGGDQLFHVSPSYLADLFARLQWRELRVALRAENRHGVRAFLRWCVAPWLPDEMFERIQKARKRYVSGAQAMELPPWLTDRWRVDGRLKNRTVSEPTRRFLESPSGFESRWYVETPYFSRAVSWANAIALECGVEVRSPLLDRRIIEFAASRPLSERVWRGQSKVVLREAVRSLVPDSVLAPRPTKTGIPRGYLHRQMRSGFPSALERVLGFQRLRLEELGLIDRSKFRESAELYAQTQPHILGVQLLLTLQCELWLRSLS